MSTIRQVVQGAKILAEDVNQLVRMASQVLGITDDAATSIGKLAAPVASAAPTAPVQGQVYYDSDVDRIFVYDGANWIDPDGGLRVIKQADETINNSSALQADNELIFPVAANEIWYIEVFLIIATGSTPDFQCDFGQAFPAAATLVGRWVHTNAAGTIVDDSINSETDAATVQTGTSAAAPMPPIQLYYVGGANAGNITLRWAQNTADASDTTVKKGSFMRGTRIQ